MQVDGTRLDGRGIVEHCIDLYTTTNNLIKKKGVWGDSSPQEHARLLVYKTVCLVVV